MFTPIPTTEAVRAALLAIYARLDDAVIPRRVDATIGEWKPEPHYCFDNVDAWVQRNSSDKAAYGFVYFDYRGWGLGFVRFTAHAVIEREDGTLADITPHGASTDYPFIRHTGTLNEFKALVEQQGANIGLDLVLP